MNPYYELNRDEKDTLYRSLRSAPFGAHYHHGVEIVACLGEKAVFSVDGVSYTMTHGSVLTADSYAVHAVLSCDSICTVILPHSMLGSFEARKRGRTLRSPLLQPGPETQMILSLMDELENWESMDALELQGIADLMLGRLCRLCGLEERGETADAASARQILVYLETHFREDVTLPRMARELAYSPCHISHILNRVAGRNLNTCLNDLRIRAAEEELRLTRDSLQEIAFRCGFQSVPTFYRAFRRVSGMTPTQFRAGMEHPAPANE